MSEPPGSEAAMSEAPEEEPEEAEEMPEEPREEAEEMPEAPRSSKGPWRPHGPLQGPLGPGILRPTGPPGLPFGSGPL